MPEEAHYCLQCMTPCTPAQPSTAYLKSCAEHSQKRINRKQISSVLAAMILLVVLIPSVMAAPLHQQNTATAEGALTGTVQAAETEEQPKTLLRTLFANKIVTFCVLRRFSAILQQCKKLCGFCLTGSRLRAIMNT